MEENKVAQMSDNDLHLIAERIWLRLRNERRASADELNDIFRELVAVRDQATKGFGSQLTRESQKHGWAKEPK